MDNVNKVMTKIKMKNDKDNFNSFVIFSSNSLVP